MTTIIIVSIKKKNKKYFGRKTVIDKKLISQVQDLKEELNYIPYNRLVKNVNQEAVNEGK